MLRGDRSSMPRFYYSEALDTSQMQVRRRISVIFKDVPGGQKLGPKFDDIHRLLDFKLAVEGSAPEAPTTDIEAAAVPWRSRSGVMTRNADKPQCRLSLAT